MFKKLKSDSLEENKDVLGGDGKFTIPTDLYAGTIKMAYAVESKSGAMGIHLEVTLEGQEKNYTETIYITNRNGDNFYSRDGKNFPLPGFSIINDICLITTGTEISEAATENKLVNVWDFESKKMIPKEHPVLVDLIGKEISLGILEIRQNKTKLNERSGKYEPVNEEETINAISKVFDTESQLTVYEATNQKDPEFFDAWKEKNSGKTQDRYKEQKGASTGASGSAGSAKPARMQFGKK